MSERRIETLLDDQGNPVHVMEVTVPDDVWRQQESDLPGWAEFAVFEVEGVLDDGTLLYWRAGSCDNHDPTSDRSKAVAQVRGSVKWDGCANYSMVEDEGTLLHACDAEDLGHLLCAVARAYALALAEVGGGL